MSLSSEVTYNIFDPVGVLVDAVGLPIDLVDPGGISGVLADAVGLSIDFVDAMCVFLDPGLGCPVSVLNALLDPGGVTGLPMGLTGVMLSPTYRLREQSAQFFVFVRILIVTIR